MTTAADGGRHYGLGRPSYSTEDMNRRTGQEAAEDQMGGAGKRGATGRGGGGGAGLVSLEFGRGAPGGEREAWGGGGAAGQPVRQQKTCCMPTLVPCVHEWSVPLINPNPFPSLLHLLLYSSLIFLPAISFSQTYLHAATSSDMLMCRFLFSSIPLPLLFLPFC